jgi:hypothetical protein
MPSDRDRAILLADDLAQANAKHRYRLSRLLNMAEMLSDMHKAGSANTGLQIDNLLAEIRRMRGE